MSYEYFHLFRILKNQSTILTSSFQKYTYVTIVICQLKYKQNPLKNIPIIIRKQNQNKH